MSGENQIIKVVWGCCWFNETTDTVEHFMLSVIRSFKTKNLEIVPVIFVANLDIKEEEILRLRKSLDNVVLLKNQFNIYPNKNYGIFSIVTYAHEKHLEYVAIVDPDWSINECDEFVETILQPILSDKVDLIIPNIGSSAGRDNKLIGSSIINLFYPDYKNNIVTPFPGSFSAVTEKIFSIVNSDYYHFDWGGEWDIISYSISNNYLIKSIDVNLVNVRHRKNSSKVQDAYQMWRAVFSNYDIIKRFHYLSEYNASFEEDHPVYKAFLRTSNNISEIIAIANELVLNSTEKQLLYMILHPLSCIINNTLYDYDVIDCLGDPYDKNLLEDIQRLAIICIKRILEDSHISVERLHDTAKIITGGNFGNWTIESTQRARKKMLEQIKALL